jgi:hypothetical protein
MRYLLLTIFLSGCATYRYPPPSGNLVSTNKTGWFNVDGRGFLYCETGPNDNTPVCTRPFYLKPDTEEK